ncbi:MAG: 4-hydroxybenzoate octaprenyltransferase [Alphaproteobacteria bacterium]|nr:4-hydroxybenzoate octaprenyltransferase [Alphaproteobacteria bacterium]
MKLPTPLRLMRLHQPAGILLLLWPCWWSAALASPGAPSPRLLALFAAGAVLMRGAGCIINDLWDRKIDAAVTRTRSRPLACGEMSVRAALILLCLLLALSLAVALVLGFRVTAWAAAALPLVTLYPAMKRLTWWPQAFLGLTFNWGALLGSVAVQGRVTLPAVLLYAAGFFWTLGYDTAYALQDGVDDAAIGVKSTARRFGKRVTAWVGFFYGCCLGCAAAAGMAAGASTAYFILLLPVTMHFAWQINILTPENPGSGRRAFLANPFAGALIFAACLCH